MVSTHSRRMKKKEFCEVPETKKSMNFRAQILFK